MDEVILVNADDQEVGTMEKLAAHRLGLLHRAFSVFIFNVAGDMLIHQRAFHKYHSGGLWTNACCSHPRPGEKTIDAARRRLGEELSIQTELKEIFSFTYETPFEEGLSENEFDHVYVGYYDGPIEPDPNEICDYRYVSPDSLLQRILDHPSLYTVWFKMALPRVLKQVSG